VTREVEQIDSQKAFAMTQNLRINSSSEKITFLICIDKITIKCKIILSLKIILTKENNQMEENFTPAPSLIITDLEAVKAIADPLRNQIIEVLSPAPMTVNQIAEKLGLAPSNLYYHVNLLEKHGFLKVINTTIRGNII
jgi:predicted Rossmann fold nucleotide-binding protein DprA/Smf involved in DNA uptake